ncbi:hypothetical protein DFH07DRAFT_773138 [Mycena maculata]|uniref:Uncharacterized protein n=1 Tax=Mycena maculata TaxID=230809 RepID=A0AAD7NE35_9AGAR|nr:hypothetical protein DFH07DRAFT_773138 [Mycena maculata]
MFPQLPTVFLPLSAPFPSSRSLMAAPPRHFCLTTRPGTSRAEAAVKTLAPLLEDLELHLPVPASTPFSHVTAIYPSPASLQVPVSRTLYSLPRHPVVFSASTNPEAGKAQKGWKKQVDSSRPGRNIAVISPPDNKLVMSLMEITWPHQSRSWKRKFPDVKPADYRRADGQLFAEEDYDVVGVHPLSLACGCLASGGHHLWKRAPDLVPTQRSRNAGSARPLRDTPGSSAARSAADMVVQFDIYGSSGKRAVDDKPPHHK